MLVIIIIGAESLQFNYCGASFESTTERLHNCLSVYSTSSSITCSGDEIAGVSCRSLNETMNPTMQ